MEIFIRAVKHKKGGIKTGKKRNKIIPVQKGHDSTHRRNKGLNQDIIGTSKRVWRRNKVKKSMNSLLS